MQTNISIKSQESFIPNKDATIEKYALSDQFYLSTRISQKMSQSTATNTSLPFTIEYITEDDAENVIKFLKEYFFQDEPLNKFLKLGECKELENYSLKCIPSKLSLKAVDQNGKMLGIILNDIMHRQESVEPEAENCQHPKFKKILTMMEYIDTQFNIFNLYSNLNAIAEGKIIAVSSEHRGLGIATELIEKTLTLLKERDIKLITILCSSHYSARALEKLNFHEVYRLRYADYKVNDEVVFKPEPPHECARILVKDI